MSDVGTKGEMPEFLQKFQRHNEAYNQQLREAAALERQRPIGLRRRVLRRLIVWLMHYAN